MVTIRTLLSLASLQHWQVFQMDVKAAFLNGYLEEDVYMEQPEGFIDPAQEGKVCKLRKAIYGLKQAPRAWYTRIDTYFIQLGLRRSASEPTLYYCIHGDLISILVLYVDDLVITGSDLQMIDQIKSGLCTEFEMTDLGLLHQFLGLEIWQLEDRLCVSQIRYVLELLEEFRMLDSKPVATPMEMGSLLTSGGEEDAVDSSLYRRVIGKLIYLSNTRPDICFALGVLSQFSADPRQTHWRAAKRVLRYLAGSPTLGLVYDRSEGFVLYGYSDSDWAGDTETRRSTSGYCFSLGTGFVSWSSKKQQTVALSSTEAEYRACTSAACEAVWLRRILDDMGAAQESSTLILTDNQSCLAIAKNPVFHARTKHIEIQYHFIRDRLQSGEIQVEYCPSVDNVADVFTKPLPRASHCRFRELLGVLPMQAMRGGVGDIARWFPADPD